MDSDVTIDSATVYFTTGDDSTEAGLSIGTNSTYAHLASLSAYPNVTLTYEEAVNVTNGDSSAHNIRLRHVSISPASGDDVGNFTSVIFRLMDDSGSEQVSLSYTVSGSSWNTPSTTGWVSLPASDVWSIRVETVAEPGALANIDCSITIAIDVE
jgi:hypothetical protein